METDSSIKPGAGASADDLLGTLAARRSVRRYRAEPVPRAMLMQMLEAARWAPSAHNRQPWRFVVVQAPVVQARLATALGTRLQAERLADGDDAEVVARDVARSHARISGAPVVLVACLSLADMDRYPDARRAQAEWVMAAQSTAMAVQNLLLMAHALGLGACWLCAPLFAPALVREALALPEDWEAQGLLTVGWPAEERVKPRAPVMEKVIWLTEAV